MGSLLVWVFCCLVLLCTGAYGQFFDYGENVLFGCYNANDVNGTNKDVSITNLTLAKCRTECQKKEAVMFGVLNGVACRCLLLGIFNRVSLKPQPIRSCFGKNAKRCSGNTGDKWEYCGTSDAYLIYSVCPRGKGGQNCDSTCKCTNGFCDSNGECSELCYPNSFSTTPPCTTSCTNDHYGYGCAGVCSDGCEGCDKVTGQCSSCSNDKPGPYCEGCPAGKHGENCAETCSDRCKDQNCNDTGVCYSCKLDTNWDLDCDKTCNINCSPQRCHLTTGYCEGGCVDGFYGDQCEVKCPENCENVCEKADGVCNDCKQGYYDDKCNSTCPENCVGACDRQNGSCSSCKDGWYGNECTNACPAKCLNKKCREDPMTCVDGCTAGFAGATCNITCPDKCRECHQYENTCTTCKSGSCGEFCNETETCSTTTPTEATTTPAPDSDFPIVPVVASAGSVLIIIITGLIICYCCRKGKCKKRPDEKKPIVASSPDQANGMDDYEQVNVPLGDMNSKVSSTYRRDPDRTFQQSEYELPIENIKEHVKGPRAAEKMKKEYSELPQGQKHPWEKAKPLKDKNRYKNLYAYDHSRVVLQGDPNDPSADYYNANYLPNFNRQKAFIACQGPHNDQTLVDFIRMLWECKINTVVATAKLKEKGKNGKLSMKFLPYWPSVVGQDERFGSITVKLSSEQTYPDYTLRKLCLRKEHESHQVTQFHYISWPDKDVPTVAAPLLNFQSRIRRHLQQYAIGSNSPPVVVHCSAGIGRTGVFIALDSLYNQMNKEGTIDVQACIKRLREDRVDMVQSNEQYNFVYHALCEALDLGNTIVECALLPGTLTKWRIESPSPFENQYNLLESMKPEVNPEFLAYALSEENSHKNRFRNIVAATDARVVLRSSVPPANDYINAVAVDGYGHPTAFHVTQMPLEHTVEEFWRMVWENKYPAMVALLTPDEAGANWCPALQKPITLSDLTVNFLSEKAMHRHIMAMELSVSKGDRDSIYENGAAGTSDDHRQSVYANTMMEEGQAEHRMTMYWLHQINPRSLRQAFQLTQPVYKRTTNAKICVMCLDGCQNSGLYVSSHNVLSMAEAEQEVDVFDTVRQVRATRPQFIKDIEQYKELYAVVEEYLANRHT